MDDLTGTSLGNYAILEILGRGMSAVYSARDKRTGRHVALKVLDAKDARDPQSRQRFDLAARTLEGLQHPNIVRVVDCNALVELPYLAMEIVPGRALSDFVEPGVGLVPRDWIASVIAHVAAALDYAHDQGVIHRDIKPGNIMVDDDGSTTLLDFGIAKALHGSGPRITDIDTVLGTVDYMSPEQVNGEPVDGRSDVYALGAVAYELLTGRVPYERENVQAVMFAHVHSRPSDPCERASWIPAAASDAVLRAMSRYPADRYRRAGAFAVDLVAALRSDQTVRRPDVTGPVVMRGCRTIVEAVPWPLAAAFGAVLFLLVVVALMPRLAGDSARRPENAGTGAGGIRPTESPRTEETEALTSVPMVSPEIRAATVIYATESTGVGLPDPIFPTETRQKDATATSASPTIVTDEGSDATQPPTIAPPSADTACASLVADPLLESPEPMYSCGKDCRFAWSLAEPLDGDSYFQVQFRPLGTDAVRGIHAPTKDFLIQLSSPQWMFNDLCARNDPCDGDWSVAVIRWDGIDSSVIGCVISRSEWRSISLR